MDFLIILTCFVISLAEVHTSGPGHHKVQTATENLFETFGFNVVHSVHPSMNDGGDAAKEKVWKSLDTDKSNSLTAHEVVATTTDTSSLDVRLVAGLMAVWAKSDPKRVKRVSYSQFVGVWNDLGDMTIQTMWKSLDRDGNNDLAPNEIVAITDAKLVVTLIRMWVAGTKAGTKAGTNIDYSVFADVYKTGLFNQLPVVELTPLEKLGKYAVRVEPTANKKATLTKLLKN